jgi:hypothetical protein
MLGAVPVHCLNEGAAKTRDAVKARRAMKANRKTLLLVIRFI